MNSPTVEQLIAMGYTTTLRGHSAYVDMLAQWRKTCAAKQPASLTENDRTGK